MHMAVMGVVGEELIRPRAPGGPDRHADVVRSRPLPQRAGTSRPTGARWPDRRPCARRSATVSAGIPPYCASITRSAASSAAACSGPARSTSDGGAAARPCASSPLSHPPRSACRAPIASTTRTARSFTAVPRRHGRGARPWSRARAKAETATWIPMRPGTRTWTAGRCPRSCRGARGASAQSTGTEQQCASAERLSHAMPRARSGTDSPGLRPVQISMVRHE